MIYSGFKLCIYLEKIFLIGLINHD